MERAILFFDIDGTVLSEVTKEVPGFRPRGKCRGQQERAAGKAPQRES